MARMGDIEREAAEPPPSPEQPVYAKLSHSTGSGLYMITCDEGRRKLIVCTGLYENVADWLLGLLGRQPYARREDR